MIRNDAPAALSPNNVKPYKKVDNFAHVNASIRMQGVSISENANYLFGYKRTRPGPFKPRDFCATFTPWPHTKPRHESVPTHEFEL